jgi:hypothetical protein
LVFHALPILGNQLPIDKGVVNSSWRQFSVNTALQSIQVNDMLTPTEN